MPGTTHETPGKPIAGLRLGPGHAKNQTPMSCQFIAYPIAQGLWWRCGMVAGLAGTPPRLGIQRRRQAEQIVPSQGSTGRLSAANRAALAVLPHDLLIAI